MRIIDVTGVVEDGTPGAVRSLNAPPNPRQTIVWVQGTTLQIRYKVVTASGQPVDLSKDGAVLTLTVRKLPLPAGQGRPAGQWTGVALPEVGLATFTVQPADMPPQRVMWGRYTYDVTLARTSAGTDKTTPLSPWVVEPSDL